MLNIIGKYTNWLHTRWPAGVVEKLPEVNEDGSTNVPGIRIAGDLTGIPLLKFSSDSGAKTILSFLEEPDFIRNRSEDPELLDVAIIGGGVAGISAALEAQKQGLRYKVFEASQVFATVANFPKAKPIYTYPTDLTPAGLQFTATVKEPLLEEMENQRKSAGIEITYSRIEKVQKKSGEFLLTHGDGKTVTRARRVVIAIGRSGNHRKLNVPGENLDKVYNRLHDPKEFAGKDVLVVGGGDSALETAIAVALCGANVTISYRKKEFARPKPDNIAKIDQLRRDPKAHVAVEKPVSERVTTSASYTMRGDKPAGSIHLALGTQVTRIEPDKVILTDDQKQDTVLRNDTVFSMIGREAPLDFFRRSGIRIRGEWSWKTYAGFFLFFLFCFFVYNWKAGGSLNRFFRTSGLFPFNVTELVQGVSEYAKDPSTLLGVLAVSLGDPGFYYSFAYTLCVTLFGIRRIKRRKTPYVRIQTLTLMAIQIVPLFLLPFIILPWAGQNGWFDSGAGKYVADHLFPAVNYGHKREYWRAFGLVLAWPLFFWNLFTSQPLWWWLGISFVQTFVAIPLIIRRWGKGAYCSWICSCGALAETMGDAHRQKMPHGPFWNRVNMVGQVVLGAAFLLLAARILSWIWPATAPGLAARKFYSAFLNNWTVFGINLDYYHMVDIFMAGIIGVGMYFWFSGRVWCRFACPLAALMNIYARFTKFRIFADKPKCISCNVCTSVCHQGIDVMNFANKGLPMQDPQCVRCSACVQMCPTGTLSFGRIGKDGKSIPDKIPASLVQIREKSK